MLQQVSSNIAVAVPSYGGSILTCESHDNSIRWKHGERLEHIFEQRCDAFAASGQGDHPAVLTDELVLSYCELDRQANQVAWYLRSRGVKPGDRIGLLFDRTFYSYVAVLGVLKAGAAYVPLDITFPQQRIEFIVGDAEVSLIVTVSDLSSHVDSLTKDIVSLDTISNEIAKQPTARLDDFGQAPESSGLCYVIYTSGTTGNPKGVAIDHKSICNFVRVAEECYGVTEKDRMYQGMTLAFDFSVEEVWVALASGASLVPAPPGIRLVGGDLADFLNRFEVTALACVPTLLATIDTDLPTLRFLLLSGEACPPDLVKRWYRPGRRILNAYGPTETTVTATWRELTYNAAVSIGGPLPTYSIVILDPDHDELVDYGEPGEIGIAGIGLADGYVNRPELTEKAFIPDFVGLPHNPSERIYRTGDLGRITETDEIEYLGRIDTQVKVKGYRIETTEIESVLLRMPQIAQAVVHTHEIEPGVKELVAFYTVKDGASDPTNEELAEILRAHLPVYMIPAYIEGLNKIPMLPSDKADRKALPAPRGPRFTVTIGDFVAPATDLEAAVAKCLGEVLEVDAVSTTADFFDELGIDSLLMAHFCTMLRETLGDVDVSMRDVYLHRTVASLAQHIETATDTPAPQIDRPPDHVASRFAYYRTGALQLATSLVAAGLSLKLMVSVVFWVLEFNGAMEFYQRVVVSGLGLFALFTTISVAGKWLVYGRFRQEAIPIWSMRHYRFWLAKQFIQLSPMRAFARLPVYNLYLRLLGARIGRGTVIHASHFPVCTDLISIGADSVLRKDSVVIGYRAQGNYILTGPIEIGDRVVIGEKSILDIDSTMEDDSRLAHASSLQTGQRVPRGEYWHGSPARAASFAGADPQPHQCTILRRGIYSAIIMGNVFFCLAPLLMGIFYLVVSLVLLPDLNRAGVIGEFSGVNFALLADLALLGTLFYVGGIILGGVIVITVPKVLSRFIEPGRSYVLYGVHYTIAMIVKQMSNVQFFNLLFGDSVFIVHYLTSIGWDLGKIEQTGSNFGVMNKQDSPVLSAVGRGTMISDGISMDNIRITSTSIQLSAAKVGARSFLGNDIHVISDHRVGDNCLLGTKVMMPLDGSLRENVGLLGSPPFEIPRFAGSVDENPMDDRELHQRIKLKTKHNLASMAMFLTSRWVVVLIGIVTLYAALVAMFSLGIVAAISILFIGSTVAIGFFIALERSVWGFGSMHPTNCTIYDPYYWRVERYWKLGSMVLQRLFKGTPYKNFISRLLGVQVGTLVFDDGAVMTEKTLVSIGDRANINEGCTIQSHSLENGDFKSDHITLGAGSTIGVGAFIHYGVCMEPGATLDCDSFLMKGEIAPAATWWRGNPARMLIERNAATDIRQTLNQS